MKCFHVIFFSWLFSFVILIAKAQSFTGYDVATYAGVYNTLFNPANILNHRVKADVN